MANITVKINKRNLTGLIRKKNFDNGGMFISYQFIALDFETDKNNTATFYENTQVSQNSWTNYPGEKVWDNMDSAKWLKSNIIAACEERMDYVISKLENRFPEINFELIGF
jgi:hypothetical protein